MFLRRNDSRHRNNDSIGSKRCKIGIYRRSAVLINRLNHSIFLCFYVFCTLKFFTLNDILI